MPEIAEQAFENFDQNLKEFREATDLTRPQQAQKMISQVDRLSRNREGLEYLYHQALKLEEAGIFENTPWQFPRKQVPTLVKGTLMSGHPNSSFEILSELRILAYARGESGTADLPAAEARSFLEEVVVHNMEFAFDELTEESRSKLTQQERRKVVHYFQFLMEMAQLDGIKEKLAEEIRMVVAQRPVVTQGVRNLIQTMYQKMDLDPQHPVDKRLQYFVNALYAPGALAGEEPNYDHYRLLLKKSSSAKREEEARQIGAYLHDTGLTNPYLAMLLRYAVKEQEDLVPTLLQLSDRGRSEWQRHQSYLCELILDTFSQHNYRGIYGLKRMLERGLFSRRAVRAGLTNLKLISMHPQTEERIIKSVAEPHAEVSARQYLMAALISVLGQPLGIGQGNNATCQSARGMSMWAQHSPAKLINMVTTVAASNNLIMRFENQDLESLKLSQGLIDTLDHKLDAVSVTLVPHLDKIYNEMMRRAAGRGEDPHKWANPALYGQWIEHNFASAYSYLTNSIQDYHGFVRLFYACFHPQYNGGREMVYPNPIGLFITSSRGDMLGFHAVSLLRVAEHKGEVRAYYFNPNNEGRQDWGQEITPTVYGHGEKPGESSLPLHQFMARVYAFHFNHLDAQAHLEEVPETEIKQVEALARESWGRNYQWSEIPKIW